MRELSDEDLVNAVAHHVLHLLAEHGNAAFSSFSPGLRAIHATDTVNLQVRNGGFAQMFFNSSREYVPAAIEGFRRIGAAKHVELLEEAAARAAASRDMSDLDSAWWSLDSTAGLASAYARAHASECDLDRLEECFAIMLGQDNGCSLIPRRPKRSEDDADTVILGTFMKLKVRSRSGDLTVEEWREARDKIMPLIDALSDERERAKWLDALRHYGAQIGAS